MASVNRVILIGNLGKDVELRSFPSGDQVATVTLATTDKWKDKQSGEMKEATEWHRVVFSGRLAEIAGQYMRKGSQVYVEGSLRTRKWTDQSGVEKYTTEIRADQMQMLGSRQANDNTGHGQDDTGGNGQHQSGYAERRQAHSPTQRQAPAYASRQAAPAPRQPAPVQRQPATAQPQASSGFDDMDDDIPFVTASMFYDMTTSKSRRMVSYDY